MKFSEVYKLLQNNIQCSSETDDGIYRFSRKIRVRVAFALLALALSLAAASVLATIDASAAPFDTVQRTYLSNVPTPLVPAPILGDAVSSSLSKYEVAVAFMTVEVEDDTLFIGETLVQNEGVDGVREITERVEFRNGVEVGRTAVESTIVVEPIDKVILVGVNPAHITTSHGIYFWPADGEVTSGFGKRSLKVGSSNHKGVDVCGNKGDAIYAADGGEVIVADSKMKGFGKLVQILHDNGDVTFYAHNSELLVKAGERVARGQQIAKMGSTGQASGVHCHFELHIDGVAVDPEDYLPTRPHAEG